MRRLDDPANANYRDLTGPAHEVNMLVQSVSHPSRVHVDIETDDIDAEVLRLERLGARRTQYVKHWRVIKAPTGQRCCVVPPQRSDFNEHANVWGGTEEGGDIATDDDIEPWWYRSKPDD